MSIVVPIVTVGNGRIHQRHRYWPMFEN